MLMRLACVALCAMALGGVTAQAGPAVTVDGVVIEGAVSPFNSNVNNYYAIPYATASRWSPPKPHPALSSPFNASNYATAYACPQPGTVYVGSVELGQSEDCLTLSVHVPASATPTSALPVYVFIHGGSLEQGSGLQYFPDDMVAANNIIVVTINYRLGALGWMAQSAFAAAQADAFENAGDAGNYGLMDQQFALRWVRNKITAFGGDRYKVTIGGQSAGGLSVALNMASVTTAKNLFRAAIIESGSYDNRAIPPLASYETLGNSFVDQVLAAEGKIGSIDCPSLTSASPSAEIRTCLDGASMSTILAAQQAVYGGFLISPDSGTLVIPNGVEDAFEAGAILKVPVMQGSNLNEGRYFEPSLVPFGDLATVAASGGPANWDLSNANAWCGNTPCTYAQEIGTVLNTIGVPAGVNTAAFDSHLASTDYPLANFPDPYLSASAPSADEGLAQIMTDYEFSCNAYDADSALANYVYVFAYELNDPLAPPTLTSPAVLKSPNDQYGYATASEHGSELEFLFEFPYTDELSSGERQLQETMQTYWANFIKNGNPNTGSAVPAWLNFKTRKVLSLVPGPGNPALIGTFQTEHFCGVWEPILSSQ